MLKNLSCFKKLETTWEWPRTKKELLKKQYYDPDNPAAYAGKSKLLQDAEEHDSNISAEDIEEWFKSHLAYTFQLQNEASRGASNRWAMADWFGGYE